jgi:hypothetical protein
MTMFDVSKLAAVVRTAAEAYSPGVPAAMAAADAIFDLVKSVLPTLAADEAAELEAALPELLEKMDRDVDAAIAGLRG